LPWRVVRGTAKVVVLVPVVSWLVVKMAIIDLEDRDAPSRRFAPPRTAMVSSKRRVAVLRRLAASREVEANAANRRVLRVVVSAVRRIDRENHLLDVARVMIRPRVNEEEENAAVIENIMAARANIKKHRMTNSFKHHLLHASYYIIIIIMRRIANHHHQSSSWIVLD
jgi:hypothetical protein